MCISDSLMYHNNPAVELQYSQHSATSFVVKVSNFDSPTFNFVMINSKVRFMNRSGYMHVSDPYGSPTVIGMT